MKNLFLLLSLLTISFANAQQDCDYSFNQKTEEGIEVKGTKEYMMYEKIFGGNSQYIFFSLTNNGGTPLLNFKILSKSTGFPELYCFDNTSKIYIQLTNGKIITLISATQQQCATLVYNPDDKKNMRVLSGTFLFTKGSLEELEKSSITYIRVRYTTDTVDYPIRNEIESETIKEKYFPNKYFINYLNCIK
ncbi:hypothetical protein GCM10007424_21510 [Flavobacterium suaedae]|uniref:Uncharacterized protein n=1 Tax=Flavobacterium suaedae TaxID=1767027 RepID=A0ABQ1JXA7_9FLAO|nr:hypothetical protein [Flavobacterium suaedae]GGB81107.1 hypothetical protein GCM10007424_21510 [Flavobacterium suaedae]